MHKPYLLVGWYERWHFRRLFIVIPYRTCKHPTFSMPKSNMFYYQIHHLTLFDKLRQRVKALMKSLVLPSTDGYEQQKQYKSSIKTATKTA